MSAFKKLISYLRVLAMLARKQPKRVETGLNDLNAKRILDKQYTDEELEIKQMLKDIDNKRR